MVGAYSNARGSGPGRLFNQGSNWDPRKRFYLFRIRDVKVTGQSDFLITFSKQMTRRANKKVIDAKNGLHKDIPIVFMLCYTVEVTDFLQHANICIIHAHT